MSNVSAILEKKEAIIEKRLNEVQNELDGMVNDIKNNFSEEEVCFFKISCFFNYII